MLLQTTAIVNIVVATAAAVVTAVSAVVVFPEAVFVGGYLRSVTLPNRAATKFETKTIPKTLSEDAVDNNDGRLVG